MSELKPRHSPLPWNYDDPDGKIRAYDGVIATIWNFVDPEVREANAKLIVHRVNAHEGLVEALEQIRKFSHGGAVSMSVDAGEFHEIELLAEAALAQAKGGE